MEALSKVWEVDSQGKDDAVKRMLSKVQNSKREEAIERLTRK